MNGQEIKELRLKLGWSQMRMASKVGSHVSTIQKLEWKGKEGKASPLLEKELRRLEPAWKEKE